MATPLRDDDLRPNIWITIYTSVLPPIDPSSPIRPGVPLRVIAVALPSIAVAAFSPFGETGPYILSTRDYTFSKLTASFIRKLHNYMKRTRSFKSLPPSSIPLPQAFGGVFAPPPHEPPPPPSAPSSSVPP